VKNIIRIINASENNLRSVSLDIPRNKLVVVTGISGSGKSSLVFDVLYREAENRYFGSFSTHARQFLGKMRSPDVERVEGLSPAIVVDQKTVGRNVRSTVGTITEIWDYLRLLFARVGKPVQGDWVHHPSPSGEGPGVRSIRAALPPVFISSGRTRGMPRTAA